MTKPCEGKQLGLTKRIERLTTQTNVGDEIGNWMTKLANSAGTLTQKDDVMTELTLPIGKIAPQIMSCGARELMSWSGQPEHVFTNVQHALVCTL